MHLLTLCHISLERVSVSLLGLILLNRYINGARLLMSYLSRLNKKSITAVVHSPLTVTKGDWGVL